MSWVSAVIEAAGNYLSANAARDDARESQKIANANEYKYSSQFARYNKALEDYYKLRDRSETRAAANEYGKFSTLDQWAPGYQQTYRPLEAPNAPPTGQNTADMSYYNGYNRGGTTVATQQPSTTQGSNTPTSQQQALINAILGGG